MKIFFAGLLFFLVPDICSCQQYVFSNYNVQDGLAQSKVYAMLQDRMGYFWIGTDDGVTRFDGKTFQNYTSRDGLAEGAVLSVLEDKNNVIWLGHNSGGVTKVFQNVSGGLHREFKTITIAAARKTEGKLQQRPLDKRILSMFEDRNGCIWLCTEDFGAIQLLNPGKEIYDSSSIIQHNSGNGFSNVVISMIQDSRGTFWFITDEGIKKYFPDEKKFNVFNAPGLPNKQFTCIVEDQKNNIWIGSYNGGVVRFNPKQSRLDNFTTAEGLCNDWVTGITLDHEGNTWISSWGNGASVFRNNHFETMNASHGLASDKIRCVFTDREGNVWFGTNEDGLSCFKGKRFITWTTRDGLLNGQVNAVYQDREKNFWLGTNEGLSIFYPAKKIFQNIPLKNKMGLGQVMAVTGDRYGNIWVGTLDGGLAQVHPITLKLKIFTQADFLIDNHINSLETDADGNIWVGTIAGITVFHPQRLLPKIFSMADGLSGNNIAALYRDSKNNMWIGSRDGGLDMYDGKSFRTFSTSGGFSHRSPVSITEDHLGVIWIGTEGGGIFSYDARLPDGQGKSFVNFRAKDGLLSDFVTLIISDQDNIWVGTNKGLNKFFPAKKQWRHYNSQDGFTAIETKHNAVCKDSDGKLWFGTPLGLVNYVKEEDRLPLIKPITQLTGFKIGLNESDLVPGMTLNYKQRDLTFEYNGLSFTSPEKVRYRYRLKGFDSDWHPPTDQRRVSYTNLPAGEYVFQVISYNVDGIWNADPVEIPFSIQPPFTQTLWFYLLISLFISGIVATYIRIRTRVLRNQKQILEQNVEQRTAELKHTLEELKSTQEQLVQSEKLASLGALTAGIAHEIKNPLNFVNNFSQISHEMIEDLERATGEEERAEIYRDLKQNLSKITEHGKRADSIVKSMLDHSRTVSGEKQLVDINKLCEESMELAYQAMRSGDPGFTCNLEKKLSPDLPHISIVPREISRVLINLFNNAFFATSSPRLFQDRKEYLPQVLLITVKANQSILIKIRDNGTGIPDAIRTKIFEPFFTTKPPGQGTGLGLSLSYDIIKAHGGDLKFTSEENEFTEFVISLPAH